MKNKINIVWYALGLALVIFFAYGFMSCASEVFPSFDDSIVDFYIFQNDDNYYILGFNGNVSITSPAIVSSGGNNILNGSGSGSYLMQSLLISKNDGSFSEIVDISSSSFWSNVKWSISIYGSFSGYERISSSGISYSVLSDWYLSTFPPDEPPAPDIEYHYFSVWSKDDRLYLLMSNREQFSGQVDGRIRILEYSDNTTISDSFDYPDGNLDMISLGYSFLFTGTESECDTFIANYDFNISPPFEPPIINVDLSKVENTVNKIYFLVGLSLAWIVGTGFSKKVGVM